MGFTSNEMRSAQHTDPLTPEWGGPAISGGVDTDWQKEIFRPVYAEPRPFHCPVG